jgi:hypothetical protein
LTEPRSCPECGVPEHITKEHLWLDNGDIVQSRDHSNRMNFFESENFDPLFRNIEEIIGMSIEHIAVTAMRRAVRGYLSRIVPKELVKMIQAGEVDPMPVIVAIINVAKMMGYGRQELIEYRLENDEDDYCTVDMLEPFSVPLTCGAIIGAVEAVVNRDYGAMFGKLSKSRFRVAASRFDHPEEIMTRMRPPAYVHREGSMELERCATCGGPQLLSGFHWLIDQGIIINQATRRRIVMIGPAEIDPIFEELELELGETIPSIVVEAQRQFTKSGFYRMEEVDAEWDFRNLLALRGLGNLREIKLRRRGLHMILDNVALPLLVVGIVQGVFEAAFDVDSTVEWEVSEGGDLHVEVLPRHG